MYALPFLSGLILASTAIAGQMASPAESLVSLEQPTGWFISVAYAQSDREVRFGETLVPIDFRRVTASTGADLLPFLTVRAEAGWVSAESGPTSGNGGLEWGIGARAALWEYIIAGSPALPRRHAVRLETDVAYHVGTSNFEDTFEWTELTVAPLLRYTHDRSTEAVWNHRQPTGISVYGGVQYSDWSLDLGALSGEGNRDFALRLGSDLRMGSGWLAQLDATLYNGSDRRYTVGMGYHF